MTTQIYQAQRRTIQIGETSLEIFLLPDGSYRLAQSEVTGAIGNPSNLSQFCWLAQPTELVQLEEFTAPLSVISIETACAYWQKSAESGNDEANAILFALFKRLLNPSFSN